MTDYSELKRLAEDLVSKREKHDRDDCSNEDYEAWHAAEVQFEEEVGPKVFLALIAENEALRKRIEDLSPFKDAPMTGPNLNCLVCGGYHGMSDLPCPKMKFTAQVELPEFRTGQIGTALSKGEQP